jgi:hypothetical protein
MSFRKNRPKHSPSPFAQIFGLRYIPVKVTYALILTENWLGYIVGGFFCKNSSGHPAWGRATDPLWHHCEY